MVDILQLGSSSKMVFYILISFSFVIGIILMISPEGFDALNKSFQKEFGIRTRLVPKLEDTFIDVIDRAMIKNPVIAGLCISVTSFFLLLIYK